MPIGQTFSHVRTIKRSGKGGRNEIHFAYDYLGWKDSIKAFLQSLGRDKIT